jgi:hypothetical protein
MANKIDTKDIVSVEEVLLANAIEQEALVRILVNKGLISKKEVLAEIKKIRERFQADQ